MNLLLLVVLVSILLLILGIPSQKKPVTLVQPKETGYKTPTDYYLDVPSVYGAFKK